MDGQKFHVWQPTANILKGDRIYHFEMSTENGIIISLTDQYGTTVDVVYDQASQEIGDYVWLLRYSNKTSLSDSLVQLLEEAEKNGPIPDPNGPCFFKITNSHLIEWFYQAGHIIPSMEHHVFPVSNGVIDIVSDYEPKFIVKKRTE